MALMPTWLGLGLTFDWLGRWLEISISELVSFCAAVSTSVDGSGTRDVVRTRSLPGRSITASSGRHGV
jgi:hypothetical protein